MKRGFLLYFVGCGFLLIVEGNLEPEGCLLVQDILYREISDLEP